MAALTLTQLTRQNKSRIQNSFFACKMQLNSFTSQNRASMLVCPNRSFWKIFISLLNFNISNLKEEKI